MKPTLIAGGVSAALLAGLLASVTPMTVSNAAWQSAEWVHAPGVGTLDCDDPGIFRTRGNGRLLSGGLLGLDLDTVAEVRGMLVTNDSTTATPTPSGATAGAQQSWSNPLDVSVLGLINLPLSPTALDDLLEIPLGADVGVINQWARAGSDGTSGGAAGVVNNSGVIMTSEDFNGGQPPGLATLKLSEVVTQVTGEAAGDLVAGLTEIDLEIGGVAGRATVDSCEAAYGSTTSLQRTYTIADLAATVDSPLVGDLVTTVDGVLTQTENLAGGLAGDGGVLSDITDGLDGLLTGPLAALGLGSVDITGPTVDLDFSAVQDLLTDPIQDPAEMLTVDLDSGLVRIDLAKLLGEAYGGDGFSGTGPGLNGLDPNTELLVNAQVINALTEALTDALDAWIADVLAAVRQAVLLAEVNFGIQTDLGLGGLTAVDISVSATNVSLGSLLGEPGFPATSLTVDVDTLLGNCSVLNPLACTLEALLDGLTTALTTGLGPIVGDVIEAALLGPGSPVANLGGLLQGVTAPVITLVGQVFNVYLGADGLVSLRANVQNDAGAQTYPEWEGSAPQAVPDGQYDVAALGVVVLGALGTSPSINLELGRGSVGINCLVGGAADTAGRCDDY